MAYLALRDQLADRAGDVLDGHVGVDAVLVEQVDPVGAQSPQRRVRDASDLLGPAVEAALPALDVEAELRGDDDLVADGLERLAHELLVDVRAVDLGGVDEGHTAVDRPAQDGDHVVTVAGVRAVGLGHAHGPEADRRDLEPLSEGACVHGGASWRGQVSGARPAGWSPSRRGW
ncbi:hypothetical protein GCM10009809_25410 [Isoptericola hypogeus]|uniref:Uncharacterized protein n=1 Tax=Isoptericola hypogeus TaxID=300179 RepID=A0ABN2JIR5_9MICO